MKHYFHDPALKDNSCWSSVSHYFLGYFYTTSLSALLSNSVSKKLYHNLDLVYINYLAAELVTQRNTNLSDPSKCFSHWRKKILRCINYQHPNDTSTLKLRWICRFSNLSFPYVIIFLRRVGVSKALKIFVFASKELTHKEGRKTRFLIEH